MLYDNVFQLIAEIFLTLVWFTCNRIKESCINVYHFFAERVFHRAHRFNFSEVLGHNGESARCTICNKPLIEFKSPARLATHTLRIVLTLVSLLFAIARADNFAGIRADSVFLRDSIYTLKVAVTQSTCDAERPCILQIASEGGSGTSFKNLYGNPGDTISVPYNFPASQFKSGSVRATLFFFGSDNKAKDILMIGLGYKDIKPTSMGFRRRTPRFHSPELKWERMINGRKFN
jgi:hypothetical protein